MWKAIFIQNCLLILLTSEFVWAQPILNATKPLENSAKLVSVRLGDKSNAIAIVQNATYATKNLKKLPKKVLRKSSEDHEISEEQDKLLAPALDDMPARLDQRPWPLGVVPYYFDHSSYDEMVAERVRVAMNSIEEASCVQFKPLTEATSKVPWIHITNPDRLRECVHETTSTDPSGREKKLVLGFDCMQKGDILHSLMHALGFKDEVTHPLRDQFVRVKWENINPKYSSLFHINHYDFPSKTIEYDPMSIMQFHDRAFTKNGQATIVSLIPGLVINPSKELSPLDKMKLRLMFGHECNKRKVVEFVDECKYALQSDDGDVAYDENDGGDGGRNDNDGKDNDNDADSTGQNEAEELEEESAKSTPQKSSAEPETNNPEEANDNVNSLDQDVADKDNNGNEKEVKEKSNERLNGNDDGDTYREAALRSKLISNKKTGKIFRKVKIIKGKNK